MNMTWTDERVGLLTKLWADGLSASQIALQIGGVSRNAVIGKVHRLGLSGRSTKSRMKSHRPRAKSQRSKRAPRSRFQPNNNSPLRQLYNGDASPFIEPAEELEIPLAERKSIETLEANHCRWPIGDPQHDDFHFCGKSKVSGLPYCEFHARRAFQPPQARRRDGNAPAATPAIAAPTKTPEEVA